MDADIIIIGAGMAGIMAARELSRAGKKVIILEARDRTGGRAFTLDEKEFGYPAEGGAEYVHGSSPLTRSLIQEAGLTFASQEGEFWSSREGELTASPTNIMGNPILQKKLNQLKKDLSVSEFLKEYLPGKENEQLRKSLNHLVKGYNAADPKKISIISIRDEWLGKGQFDDGKIKEGYGSLLRYLENQCKKNGTKILINSIVNMIEGKEGKLVIKTNKNESFSAKKVIITVPLPLLKDIKFNNSEFKKKLDIASRIGYGHAIKVIIKFKTRWWDKLQKYNLRNMLFLFSTEKFMTFWAQYPHRNSVLTAWMGGPGVVDYDKTSDKNLLDLALTSLSNVIKADKKDIAKEVEHYRVFNWAADPFTKGAYTYTTPETKNAYDELAKPINNSVFFAGEAFGVAKVNATVEGALLSGLNAANKILNKLPQ